MKQLLNKFTDAEILKRLVEIYPDASKSIKGYKSVLRELRKLKPIKTKLILYPSKWSTTGLDTRDNVKYAIEFTRWEQWLSMPVKTKKHGLTALCYCLWEMTFMGYSQKPIQKEIKNLNKIVKK